MYSNNHGGKHRAGPRELALWAVVILIAIGSIAMLIGRMSPSQEIRTAGPAVREPAPSSPSTAQISAPAQAPTLVAAADPALRGQAHVAGLDGTKRPVAAAARSGSEDIGITLPQATPIGANLALSLTNYRASRDGGTATIVMRVTAGNQDKSPLNDVTLIMPGGRAIHVGTIQPGGEASSSEQSVSVDVSRWPSQHFSMPVTIQFSQQGEVFERPSDLALKVPGTDVYDTRAAIRGRIQMKQWQRTSIALGCALLMVLTIGVVQAFASANVLLMPDRDALKGTTIVVLGQYAEGERHRLHPRLRRRVGAGRRQRG